MPRKRTGYDAACYYDGKLLGRCTKADSDAYTLLMNACGGDAARVLREYAYFSPELKAILEKAALMQADRSRTGGMFHAPRSSPWGEVQSCEVLCPGVFLVSTASHGGTMVANEVAAVLSPAAKKCGFKDKGYISLAVDIQAKLAAGKGPGYERWAKVFNIKQMAAALAYIQDNGLTDYEQLAQKATEATDHFHALSEQIKQTEQAMKTNAG